MIAMIAKLTITPVMIVLKMYRIISRMWNSIIA
jgi:hypothetical protein